MGAISVSVSSSAVSGFVIGCSPFEGILPSMYLWLYSPLLGLGLFFSFLIFHTVGRTPWAEDQPVAGPLPTHKTTQTQNKRTYTSMSRVGLEHTIQCSSGPLGHCDRQGILPSSEIKKWSPWAALVVMHAKRRRRRSMELIFSP
jgi:hypothetical protein